MMMMISVDIMRVYVYVCVCVCVHPKVKKAIEKQNVESARIYAQNGMHASADFALPFF